MNSEKQKDLLFGLASFADLLVLEEFLLCNLCPVQTIYDRQTIFGGLRCCVHGTRVFVRFV